MPCTPSGSLHDGRQLTLQGSECSLTAAVQCVMHVPEFIAKMQLVGHEHGGIWVVHRAYRDWGEGVPSLKVTDI